MAVRAQVALVANTGWSMVRYRGELITGLLERGWRALAGPPVVIFQKRDDLELFVGAGLIEPPRTAYIAGSGVDTGALAPDWSIPP
jgi:hypothetical protein